MFWIVDNPKHAMPQSGVVGNKRIKNEDNKHNNTFLVFPDGNRL